MSPEKTVLDFVASALAMSSFAMGQPAARPIETATPPRSSATIPPRREPSSGG